MTAIDKAVVASADDASELATTVVSIIANPLANCDTAAVWNAWRFLGVTIPVGSLITAAYLTVNFTSTTLDEPDVTIYGLKTATPATFAASNTDISARARTTASVAWSNTNAGSDDVNTSSLVTIIQELVAAYDYSAGLNMGFVWTTRAADSARDTSVTSYDGSTSLCGRLHIDYAAPLVADFSNTLGALTSVSDGQVDLQAALDKALGAVTLSSDGTLSASEIVAAFDQSLGALVSASTGQVDIQAAYAVTLGALVSASTGQVDLQAVSVATLGTLTSASAGAVDIVGVASLTLGAVTLSSAAQIGTDGEASVTMPAPKFGKWTGFRP